MDPANFPLEERHDYDLTPLILNTLNAISEAYYYYEEASSGTDRAWAPPAQALVVHVISKLGDNPGSVDLGGNINNDSKSSSKPDWLVQPGLLWFHAPWIAIDLVSKNPHNVDWASKPPFTSLYDDGDHMKEGVFPRRWGNTMTTRPEQRELRPKRLSRSAKERARRATERLRREEVAAGKAQNLKKIQPGPFPPAEPTMGDVVEDPPHEPEIVEQRPLGTSQSYRETSRKTSSSDESTRQDSFPTPEMQSSSRHDNSWRMPREVNITRSAAPGPSHPRQHDDSPQDRDLCALAATPAPSLANASMRTNSLDQSAFEKPQLTEEELKQVDEYLSSLHPDEELDQRLFPGNAFSKDTN